MGNDIKDTMREVCFPMVTETSIIEKDGEKLIDYFLPTGEHLYFDAQKDDHIDSNIASGFDHLRVDTDIKELL